MKLLNCLSLAILLASGSYAQPKSAVVGLTCEHLVNPLGIDAANPRLGWRLADARLGAKQKSWQIWVGTDTNALASSAVWQIPMQSGADSWTTYRGKPLKAFTRYYWRATIMNDLGQTVPASYNWFETGMMTPANWQGAWISDGRDISVKPAPMFRKTFTLNRKPVSARAYIAVAGLYECYFNGQRVGEHYLDPMYTRFDRRNLYVTLDVSAYLHEGQNAVGMLLGNGWYNHQSTAVWFFDKAPWRARPAFCMDIRIQFEDGSVQVVRSGKDWLTQTGALVFNSIYTGEHYDARLEQPGWSLPDFRDSGWQQVALRAAPSDKIVAQQLYPIGIDSKIPAVSIKRFSDTCYVFDLGRNIAGISKITVQGPAGTIIRLKHGERLDSAGHVDQSNIDVHYRPTDNTDPFQTDIFILSGKGRESFQPRFNYKGFQYVEIFASNPVELNQQDLEGYFLHSLVPPVGKVESSNPVINGIWKAANNSYLSNLYGYPTDCPQREKNGWTGDAHIASETGLYNFDAFTVYEKWLADHRDEQQPNGVLPSIIPTGGWGYEWGNGPDWTSTIAIIPWNLYLFYGDSRPLADNYDNIKRYVDHITAISPDNTTTWGLGDWVPVKSTTPVELTSTAYYYADVTILAKAAALLGKAADASQYRQLATRIQQAFHRKFYHPETGLYGTGLQTELSVPLFWGLTPDSLKSTVAANLAQRVKADNVHLDVGLLGTKAILNALSENGYADLAYQLAAQETFPSWGWWIKNGATTLYENWPINAKSDISMNHIMFGEVGAWFYKGLAGIIPDPAEPGFRHIVLKPHAVAGLDYFTAEHDCSFGKIRSSWKRNGTMIVYEAVIPPNTKATLYLPGGKRISLAAGTHQLQWPDQQ